MAMGQDNSSQIEEINSENKDALQRGIEQLRKDWHSAFLAVLKLQLKPYLQYLTIEAEHKLGEEPVRMDFLILRNEDISIDFDFARIFRGHNVLEFKNPSDELDQRTIRKVAGYANLYIGLSEHTGDIPVDEVTLSIFRDVKPEALFAELEAEGKVITNPYQGVYYIEGITDLPFQIVVTSELAGTENAAMRLLSKRVKEEDVKQIVSDISLMDDLSDKAHAHAIIMVSASANKELFEQLRKEPDMSEALMEIMKEEVNEKIQESKLDDIKNIMETLKLSVGQAMDALKIPDADRQGYLARL